MSPKILLLFSFFLGAVLTQYETGLGWSSSIGCLACTTAGEEHTYWPTDNTENKFDACYDTATSATDCALHSDCYYDSEGCRQITTKFACPNASPTIKFAECSNATFNTSGYDFRLVIVPANSFCMISITNGFGMDTSTPLNDSVNAGKSIAQLIEDTSEGRYVDAGIEALQMVFSVADWFSDYYQNVTNIVAETSSSCIAAVYTEDNPKAILKNWGPAMFPNISRPTEYNKITSSS